MTNKIGRRFWSKVSGDEPLGCWIWTASRNPQGYGQFWDGHKNVRAHRWAYEHLRAEIDPAWLSIDHLCCNPPCVNPWHMEPVPHWVNVRRMSDRGRWRGLNITPHLDRHRPIVGIASVYRRVAEEVAELIEEAGWPVGEPVTIRAYLTRVSLDSAFRLLEAWGYVELRQGRGGLEAFVAERPNPIG